MTRQAATETVSVMSIAIPLALLAVLSGAVAMEAGFVPFGQRAAALPSPRTVTISPRTFAYREATEYFKNGLAIDAPKRDIKVETPLEIMKFQTSRAEYRRCVDEGFCASADYEDLPSQGDLPVTGVSYDDAIRYAAWLSTRTGEDWRLPTDFDLAYAAGDRFPDDALGLAADDKNPATRWLADYEREARRAASTDPRPQPKGSFGMSETGLMDFAGNIWEWTSTCNKRIDLDKAVVEEQDPKGCGIMVASGRHRSPMSTFVRNPKGGGCSVGSPPDNLGFRLVRRPTFFQSIKDFGRRATSDIFASFTSAQTVRSNDES
ncbi:SUMF1/EgtB/PvdO family nonheme iron enzyme [Rhizobium hidalgonense]|uniref:SUMF1/EgtB/PvdO family nonheme iron enzyme n=1 Tax=Rhizobium hidalgonense TaxID=1538159 RepID=UPI00287204FD|nr:SUMF1/EgtB/PvdO family nonheme iron enzyme [Rhizobium hidalgonense]MDR9808452.1 SUMF1/EgtB/PvdO family nonheme iron enzyme [Rhizobium hidalgonense]